MPSIRWSTPKRSHTIGRRWTSVRGPSRPLPRVIAGAKTIVWNGPVGVFEMPAFAKGTEGVARAIVASGSYQQSWVGVILCRRSGAWVSSIRSPMPRPAAGPCWSSSKGRPSPALPVLDR